MLATTPTTRSQSSANLTLSNPEPNKEKSEPNHHDVSSSFPEGGSAAWKTVVGAFLVQICGFGYTTSYGVYQDYYVRQYLSDESASAIAWIGSINTLLVMSGGLISGRLYDRGYFYWLLGGGSLLTAFSLFMLSLSQPQHYYQVFLTHGLCNGLASGSLYIPSIAILSHYFQSRRHIAMAIVASGSAIGALAHPLMINNLLKSGFDFPTTVRISASFVSALLLAACCLMRTRIPPPKSTVSFLNAALMAVKDKAYMAATAGFWMFVIGLYYPLFYLQLDAVKHGLNVDFAFYSLVILNAASFVGRVGSGFAANKFGVAPLITLACLGCSAVNFGMIGVSSVASVVLIAVFFGFFAGIVLALMAPMFTVLTEDLSQLGVRMGLSFAFASSAGLIGPPIQGALLTSEYIWWKPAVFSGTIGAGGFLMYIGVIVLIRRQMHETESPSHTSTSTDV